MAMKDGGGLQHWWQQSICLAKRVGWAPVAVLLGHHYIRSSVWRQPLDFAMHFSGGMAMGYVMFHALHSYEHWLGRVTQVGRLLFSFALALTVGVFWEFAELASDYFLHTHIQRSIWETLRDLIADSCGAALALVLCRLCKH